MSYLEPIGSRIVTNEHHEIFEELVDKLKTKLLAMPAGKPLPNFWAPILDPEIIQSIQYGQKKGTRNFLEHFSMHFL